MRSTLSSGVACLFILLVVAAVRVENTRESRHESHPRHISHVSAGTARTRRDEGNWMTPLNKSPAGSHWRWYSVADEPSWLLGACYTYLLTYLSLKRYFTLSYSEL